MICVAGLLSIKVTSPVTHMFSSAVRSVLQTILGVNLFGDVLNSYAPSHHSLTHLAYFRSNRIISILLILAGSTLYTWFKSRGPPPAPKPTTDPEQRKGLLAEDEGEAEKDWQRRHHRMDDHEAQLRE